jgi:autotransporter translocation and assembly factor TamB
MARLRPAVRGFLRFLLWLLPGASLAVMTLTLLAWLWLRTDAGNDWLLRQVLPLLQPKAGQLEVGRLRTDVWGRVRLEDVELSDPEGAPLIRVASADAEVALQSLVGRVVPVRALRIEGLDITVADPSVFGSMWPSDPDAPASPWAGLPVDILADSITIRGRASVAGQAWEDLALSTAITARGKQVAWHSLGLRASTAAGPLQLTGAGVWSPARTVLEATTLEIGDAATGSFNRASLHGAFDEERLAFDLDAVHLDFPALSLLVPALASVPVASPLAFTGRLAGSPEQPTVALDIQTAGGPVVASASFLPTERQWTLRIESPGLDTAPVLPSLEPLRLAGEVSAEGRGWTWPDDLTADATVDAVVTVRGRPISARGPVHVEAGKLDLARLSAQGFGVTALVSGPVDLLQSSAALTVHSADAGLGLVGAGGSARFAGSVAVGWKGVVTANVDGRLVATNVDYRGLAIGEANAEVKVGWDGRAASGIATVDATALQFEDRRAATARATVSFDDTVTFAALLSEPDREVASVEGAFEQRERRLRLDLLRLELAPGLQLVGDGIQRVRFLADGIADTEVHLRLGAASVRATGGASVHNRDTLVLAVEGLELAQLDAALPGRLPGWRGRLDVHLGIVGKLSAPSWEGDARVAGLTIPGQLDQLGAQLAFEGADGSVRVTGEAGTADHDLLHVSATLPFRLSSGGARWEAADPVEARVRLVPTDTAPISRLLGGRTIPDGRLSAELRLAGSLAAPQVGLTGSADVPLAEDGPTARLWLEAGVLDGVAKVRVVLNQSFQSRLEANLAARADPAPIIAWLTAGDARPDVASVLRDFGGAVVLKQLPLATVRRVAPFEGDVEGALAGAFVLSGNPLAPRIQGGINLVGARVGTLRVEPATLEVMPLPLGYKVDATFGFAELSDLGNRASCARAPGEPAGSVRLKGFVPLDEAFDLTRAGLSLEVSGSGLPLAAVEAFVPAITETAGCLALGGHVVGTVHDPQVAVGLSLQQGSATLVPLGVRLDQMDLEGRFQEGRLVVDSFSAHTDSGRPRLDQATSRLSGRAEVVLTRGAPSSVSGRLQLDHAWLIAKADRAMQVTGSLDVKSVGSFLDVAGNIAVDEGFLNFPSRFFAATGEGGLHPDIHVVRPGAEVAAVTRGERSGWGFTLRPKVHVDLARHLRVSAALPLQGAYGDLARSLSTVRVDAELDGAADLTYQRGELALIGELETTRGTADILGRPFDLTGGTIAFTGADVSKPILDLSADYAVSCSGEPSTVKVAISGVPGAPELRFSGEGALADQDAILRALVLGRCPGDDSADAASQDALLGLVAGMLTDDLASSGQALFQLESLELDTSGSTRVSVALGRNIFLTTAYDPMADASSENSFSVQVELALPYRWYLSVETGDRGVTAVSSYRKFRF